MPAKVLETPKAKQTEVDYKAKIDAAIAGFTTKARHTRKVTAERTGESGRRT